MIAASETKAIDSPRGVSTTRFAIQGNRGLRLAASRWIPSPARAVVVFAHGYTAHMGGYAHVIQALTAGGFIVYALDHRGHGGSEGKQASLDRFDDLIDDFERLVMLAKTEFPVLPVFTLGHSMGGLTVARHALDHQDGLSGMVAVSAAFIVGEGVSERKVSALTFASRLLPNLPVIGNEPASPEPATAQQLRRKRDIFSYHGRTRLNLAREIRLAGLDSLKRAPGWRLPVFFQHGTDDTVTSPQGSTLAFERASSADRSIELWEERRHNLLTDDGWEEPVGQVKQWFRDRSGRHGTVVP